MKPTEQGGAPAPGSRGSSSPGPPPSAVTHLLFLFIFWIQKPKQWEQLQAESPEARGSSGCPQALPGLSRAGLVGAGDRGSSHTAGGRESPAAQAVGSGWSVHSGHQASPRYVEDPVTSPGRLHWQACSIPPRREAPCCFSRTPPRQSGTQSRGSLPLSPNAHGRVRANVPVTQSSLPATGSRRRGRLRVGKRLNLHVAVGPQAAASASP